MMKSGYGSGIRSHPRQILTRFTDEEAQRIFKMCRRRRVTVQAFGHAAMMRALNEINLGKKIDEKEAADEAREEKKKRAEPTGLGIRERLQDDRERSNDRAERVERERERFSSPSAPIATSVAHSDEIMALARTIVDSPKTARAEVLRSACRALARGRTQEEAVRLAEDLDAAIRRLDGAPQTALERVRARMGR